MKKILTIAVLLSLLALPVFASVTEVMSLGLPAQISGTDQITRFYPQLISNFKNTIVFEYDDNPDYWGYTFIGTNVGTLGVVISPSMGIKGDTPSVPASTVAVPGNSTGLIYATNLGAMNVGASLMFGNSGTGTLYKMVATVSDKDEVTNGYSSTTIMLGASLKVGLPLDLALSVVLPGYRDSDKLYNTTNGLTDDDYETLGGMEIGVNAGTKMGNWMFDIGLTLSNVTNERQDWQDADANGVPNINTVYTSTDGGLFVDMLAGYNFAATKTLSFIIASGLNIETYAAEKDKTNDKLAGTTTYSTNANSGMTLNLPLYVAVNCKLNDTWSLMGGINKIVLAYTGQNNKTVSGTDGTTVSAESNTSTLNMDNGVVTSIGVTANIGDLKVQWMLDPMLLLDGPEFISGNGTSVATNIALVYNW